MIEAIVSESGPMPNILFPPAYNPSKCAFSSAVSVTEDGIVDLDGEIGSAAAATKDLEQSLRTWPENKGRLAMHC